MKVLRIDNQAVKVFVLKETEDSLVYIPVKSLALVDYQRLLKMEANGGELLKTMAKETLDNGRNALIQYDNIIQVLRYTDAEQSHGIRVKRPSEQFSLQDEVAAATVVTPPQKAPQLSEEPQRERKKPGPKKGTPRTRAAK